MRKKAQDEDERVKLFHSEIGRNAHTANDMFGLEVSACVPKQIKKGCSQKHCQEK